MNESLIDTSLVFVLLRNEVAASHNATNYLAQYSTFNLSHVSEYEILRGFKINPSSRRRKLFDLIEPRITYIPIDRPVILRAAEIYADLYQRGQLIGDADILIAATALEHNLSVVTRNEKHFSRIPGLTVVNWSNI